MACIRRKKLNTVYKMVISKYIETLKNTQHIKSAPLFAFVLTRVVDPDLESGFMGKKNEEKNALFLNF
jgi:hypothetical protein